MKYINKKTKEEVKLGDVFEICEEISTPFGKATSRTFYTLTSENIEDFVKQGFIIKEDNCIPTSIKYYIEKLAARLNWSDLYTKIVIDTFIFKAPNHAFTMLLKEIAITIDKQYPDHIRNSKNHYMISMTDGKVYKIINKLECFDYISVFRTKEDAEKAIQILKDLHSKLFPNLYV